MKKQILMGFILVACFGAKAQISFGFKGGYALFKTIGEVSKYNKEGLPIASEKINGDTAGFNAGIWARIKIPFLGWGVRPELNYVYLNASPKGLENAYIIQKIDVPILLNKSFFGVLNVFAGPSFQYLIKQKSLEGLDPVNISSNDFTMGIQYGIGVEIKNFGIDLRMDQSFGKDVSSFAGYRDEDGIYQMDNRPSLFIVGLYYKLF